MSTPRYDWWPNVTRMIRNYPARRQEHDNLCSQSLTADYAGTGHGNGTARTTEVIALRQMAPAKQAEYDAVKKALEITEMLPGGRERVELIRRIYWGQKKQPIKSAVYGLYIAEATGWRWHGAFVRLVAELYGYII